ncbi:MFS transporter [Nocardiopsis sp. MG754419]|uniref:MFS transporter n=1 Tax=Nocardiopsis sp. MG754419 TaxID=2259865 RepID=UPI001BAD0EDF|nr:MFS transporter [Nocardiopsis sp. MG754419]MBR8743009.1 MFS transporter [Nocardiopsis sp. MG754419]
MSRTDEPVGESARSRVADWRRHFALLWSGLALSGLGTMTFGLALPLLALAYTGSAALAGWIAAAGMVPRTLLHIPVGWVVDRHEPKHVMVVGLIGRLLCLALFVAPVLLWDAPVVILALASALHGVCGTLHSTAGAAAVPLLVPTEELAGAAAKNQARNDATQMAGRPLGGALYGLAHGVPALFDALMCLLSLGAALLLAPIREPGSLPRREPLGLALAAGFRLLRGDRFLLLSLLVCAVTNALFQVVWLVIMLMATAEGVSPFALGLVLAATGAGGLVGAMAAPYLVRRSPPARMILLCTWAWLALTLALPVADRVGPDWTTVILTLVWGGIGFVGAHMNVTVVTYHTTYVPPELLGRLTGTTRFVLCAALPLGLLSGGQALESLGVRTTLFLVVGVTGAVALVVTLVPLTPRSHRRVHGARTPPPARATPPPGHDAPNPHRHRDPAVPGRARGSDPPPP